jgi:acetyl-CoA carboxylase carboxyl transferase subunit beta
MSMAEAKGPFGAQGGTSSASAARPVRERGGWLAKIAPGVRNLVARRETPESLWEKCPDTGEMIYRPDLEAALWVTPAGRHMRIGPDLRFTYTFDGGVHDEIPAP